MYIALHPLLRLKPAVMTRDMKQMPEALCFEGRKVESATALAEL
jgi:hypothetical protein